MILILLLFVMFIGLWIGLIFLAGFIAWGKTKSKTITAIAGLMGFLLLYWPILGDLIPTLQAHKQYCEKEAGFKIYITPEQWAEENPGVLDTLAPFKKFTTQDHVELGNERFGIKFTMNYIDGLAVKKEVESLIDVKTQRVLAEEIDFSRGYGHFGSADARSLKMWLYLPSCYSDQQLQENKKIRKEFYKKLNTSWGN